MLHNERFIKDVDGVWHKLDNVLRVYVGDYDHRTLKPIFAIYCWIETKNNRTFEVVCIKYFGSKEDAEVALSMFMVSFPTYKEISA